MAREHSFKITLSNNKTEKSGLDYLLSEEPEWFVPDSDGRKRVLDALKLPHKFRRSFDIVRIKGRTRENGITELTASPADITLIELKTTKKRLPNNPKGFFFGATENEFEAARLAGDSFRFCFVCLHPETRSHKLVSLEELNLLIKVKRIQYQINLK